MSSIAICSWVGHQVRTGRILKAGALALLSLASAIATAGEPPVKSRSDRNRPRQPATVRRAAVPWDDGTYRPTVIVRRGTSQGSGTIIASVDGDTLVLTAAHVVKGTGPTVVELHRYNLGMDRRPATPGVWPRVIRSSVAAVDKAADLAIVRISQIGALPYVARFAQDGDEPSADTTVISIGIDLGSKLTRWESRLLETVRFELNDSRAVRPFLITEKVPEHGRSGGGLFLASGELVGVCIGHSELVKGTRMGVFAAGESVRRLLHDQGLTATLVRSELRIARNKRGHTPTRRVDVAERAGARVTPTLSQNAEPAAASKP